MIGPLLLWVAAAALTALVTGLILRAMLRAPAGEESALARETRLHQQRLQQIERDLALGIVQPLDAEALRREAQRQFLARGRSAAQAGAASEPARQPAGRAAAWAVLAGLPLLAVALYAGFGAPMAVAERQRLLALPQRAAVEAAAKVEAAPEDPQAWAALARARRQAEDLPGYLAALEQAARLEPDNPQILGARIEARVLQAGQRLDRVARQMLEQALTLAPEDPRLRYFQGLRLAEDGEPDQAAALWRALLAESAPNAPWIPAVQAALAEVDPAGAEILAMPAEAQAERIRGMVQGLRERLDAAPSDAEGWERLARAYQVLQDQAGERHALEQLLRLQPDRAEILLSLARLLRDMPAAEGGGEAAADALVARALTAEPENLEALVLSARAAALRGDPAAAQALAERALARVPPEDPARAELQALLEGVLRPRVSE